MLLPWGKCSSDGKMVCYNECRRAFRHVHLLRSQTPQSWSCTEGCSDDTDNFTGNLANLTCKLYANMDVSLRTVYSQISQMVAGIGLNWYGYRLKSRGEVCDLNWESIYAAGAVYFSYLLLFARFFYIAYIQTGGKAKTKRL